MPFVSVTRLRLRSLRFFLPFVWDTTASIRQAKKSPGCFGVRTRKTGGLSFWTLTIWENEESMKAFRIRSPHREAMPKLAHWCDEASLAHWVQESKEPPSWEQATERLAALGRLSKVSHPSQDQDEGRISIA